MDFALAAFCFLIAILSYLAALKYNSLLIAGLSVLCFMAGLVLTVMRGMRR